MSRCRLFRSRSFLAVSAMAALGLAGCADSSDDFSGSTSESSSSSSGSSSSGETIGSDFDDTPEDSDVDDGDAVGSKSEPSGDGLDGDELAANISRQYQNQWEELFGMPMDDEDAPVRCDALEAELDATTDCEVDMGGGAWMPLEVTVTAVTPVGIEYQVMPSLGG